MKKLSKILIITLVFVLSGSICVWAGEVNGLIEFQAGDPAVASEVNDNFNAVKTAVDENDAAITANSSSIVTNAGNIENNAENSTNRAGVQNNTWSGIAVSSTTNTEITRIKVTDTGTYDVSLNAHLVIEINATGSGRYEFTLRRDSTTGKVVGTGWWRPGSTTGLNAITIGLTGYDSGVSGPVTYFLCAKKFDSEAPNGNIGHYGLNAEWSKHTTFIIKPIPIVIP